MIRYGTLTNRVTRSSIVQANLYTQSASLPLKPKRQPNNLVSQGPTRQQGCFPCISLTQYAPQTPSSLVNRPRWFAITARPFAITGSRSPVGRRFCSLPAGHVRFDALGVRPSGAHEGGRAASGLSRMNPVYGTGAFSPGPELLNLKGG